MTNEGEKIRLFDDEEEVEDNDDFKVRPQYEGPIGQQLLEWNSELSKRFKLDERFADDFELEHGKNAKKALTEENNEKIKNIKILENLLGHEISTKVENKSFTKKKQIRFDPNDESASKLIKVQDPPLDKPKKRKKKNLLEEDKVEAEIPVSSERYIEVCPNLKEILDAAAPFSFSQKFNLGDDAENSFQNEVFVEEIRGKNTQHLEEKNRNEINTNKNLRCEYISTKTKYESFFISKGDPRLKEGLEFFRRPKSLDEIREEWQNRRVHVLELFRQRRKSCQRSHPRRVQSTQIRNSIRRNNFKR